MGLATNTALFGTGAAIGYAPKLYENKDAIIKQGQEVAESVCGLIKQTYNGADSVPLTEATTAIAQGTIPSSVIGAATTATSSIISTYSTAFATASLFDAGASLAAASAITAVGLLGKAALNKVTSHRAQAMVDQARKDFGVEGESVLAQKLNNVVLNKSKELVRAMKAAEVDSRKGMGGEAKMPDALHKMGLHSLARELETYSSAKKQAV